MFKKKYFVYAVSMLIVAAGCNTQPKQEQAKAETVPASEVEDVWKDYDTGKVLFEDKAPDTEGSKIYHRIVTDPESYIQEQARTVLATLYDSPEDSIAPVYEIHYTLEDIKGVSAKGGDHGNISIFYSTQHIEKSFANQDTAKLFFETRGVLLHELTHAYQLEPQGIGNYGNSKVFWAFIEGMADAVRVANGGFHGEADRPKGGNYMDGYRTAGYFFVWLRDNKDKDFLRKFNRSTLEVVPWSFDGAVKYALGEQYNIDELWHEYQIAVGDIKEERLQLAKEQGNRRIVSLSTRSLILLSTKK